MFEDRGLYFREIIQHLNNQSPSLQDALNSFKSYVYSEMFEEMVLQNVSYSNPNTQDMPIKFGYEHRMCEHYDFVFGITIELFHRSVLLWRFNSIPFTPEFQNIIQSLFLDILIKRLEELGFNADSLEQEEITEYKVSRIDDEDE